MDAETLEALKGSIKKWEDIVAGKGVDEGSANCPLCIKSTVCRGCPVGEKTGNTGCEGSPYIKWNKHQMESPLRFHGFPSKIICPECERLAKEELEFLKSLLPKEEFKVGDRVRVIGVSNSEHYFNIGEIVVITERINDKWECEGRSKTHGGKISQRINTQDIELLKEAPMCDCKEKCENFKSKEKFKWEGEVHWSEINSRIVPYGTDRNIQDIETQSMLRGKRTRITIEEV